jgi:hypothetical protein
MDATKAPRRAAESAAYRVIQVTDVPDDFNSWSQEEKNAYFAEEARLYRLREEVAASAAKAKKPNGAGAAAQDDAPRTIIKATPFVCIDPAEIPPRRWIYGRHHQRTFLSQTVAFGGVGKSFQAMVEALAIVTNRPLLGVEPDEQTNVWYWNGEDPMDELQRRFAAARLHYGIAPTAIEGRLFVDSGRKTKIIVATQTRTGALIARPVVDDVIATIQENKIGVMTVDPFVSCHAVTENDNGAMEAVASVWAEIADVTGCAIELIHHARKTGGAEVTVEDGRGASAVLAKARAARVLNVMNEDEAARADIKDRRAYFKVENGKSNNAPAPASAAEWFHLESFHLANGDGVGVVTRWQWPNAFAGVTVTDLRAVQAAIAAGRWRENAQAKDWAGYAVAEVLHLDATNKAHRNKIAELLKTWIANRMFRVVEAEDEQRKMRTFIEVREMTSD